MNYSLFLRRGFVIALLAILYSGQVSATIIRENTAGTATSINGYWGQSVVTTAGGPWNNIEFNFFDNSGNLAFGNIFLLTSEYLGAPNALSAATAGYVADAAAVVGSTYVFDASVLLAAATQYWFYTDATSAGVLVGNTPSGVPGESHYFINIASGNFNGPFNGVNFTLQGDVAVPEPGTLALLGIGLAGMGLARRRRKV